MIDNVEIRLTKDGVNYTSVERRSAIASSGRYGFSLQNRKSGRSSYPVGRYYRDRSPIQRGRDTLSIYRLRSYERPLYNDHRRGNSHPRQSIKGTLRESRGGVSCRICTPQKLTTMAKVIAVANHKGGVGKTTSVACIGAGLARHGKRTLLIDLDAQQNLTFTLMGDKETESSVYDSLTKGTPLPVVEIRENLDGRLLYNLLWKWV